MGVPPSRGGLVALEYRRLPVPPAQHARRVRVPAHSGKNAFRAAAECTAHARKGAVQCAIYASSDLPKAEAALGELGRRSGTAPPTELTQISSPSACW